MAVINYYYYYMNVLHEKNKSRIQQSIVVVTVVGPTVVVELAGANMQRRLSCVCRLEGAWSEL